MIHGKVSNWKAVSQLGGHTVFEEAFAWIQEHAETVELGFHTLEKSGCSVRVMEYALMGREDANFEHHRYTIDLQVVIRGNEGIECAPVDELENKGDYLVEKDFQFLHTPKELYSFIENRSGYFSILFPDDAHQPQRITSNSDFVRKLVVKVPISKL